MEQNITEINSKLQQMTWNKYRLFEGLTLKFLEMSRYRFLKLKNDLKLKVGQLLICGKMDIAALNLICLTM